MPQLLARVTEALSLARDGSLTPDEMADVLAAVEAHLVAADPVPVALKTLSYTEGKALAAILSALPDADGGLLVASQIADRVGITRSVIVNALSKMESAGIIKPHSLGKKGTHIKILIPGFVDRVLRDKAPAA